MGQTVQQASAVVAGAEAHRAAAKEVARASERRAGALQEANGLLPSVNVAVDEALGAARCVAVRQSVLWPCLSKIW